MPHDKAAYNTLIVPFLRINATSRRHADSGPITQCVLTASSAKKCSAAVDVDGSFSSFRAMIYSGIVQPPSVRPSSPPTDADVGTDGLRGGPPLIISPPP